MTACAVLPFPLARRRDLIWRQAQYASQLSREAAEGHIARQSKTQADVMRRKGVDEALIEHECRCFETAIRVAMCRSIGLGGRN
jgi:hypothetical protein